MHLVHDSKTMPSRLHKDAFHLWRVSPQMINATYTSLQNYGVYTNLFLVWSPFNLVKRYQEQVINHLTNRCADKEALGRAH